MVQKSGDHQLRLVVVVFIYKVLAPSQMVQDFFHQQSTVLLEAETGHRFDIRMFVSIG